MQNEILPTTGCAAETVSEKKRKFEQISKKNDDSDDEVEFVKEVVPLSKKPRIETLIQLQTQQKPKDDEKPRIVAPTQLQTQQKPKDDEKKEDDDDEDEEDGPEDDDEILIQKIGKERTGEVWEVTGHKTWFDHRKEEKESDKHFAFLASKREALLYAINLYEEGFDGDSVTKMANMTTADLDERLNSHDIIEDESLGDFYTGSRSYSIRRVDKGCLSTRELLKKIK